jgi:8-oxo-dGTP diphosphatase
VELTRLPALNLWESDRLWLDMVFARTPRMFHGVAPYKDGRLVSWSYTLI